MSSNAPVRETRGAVAAQAQAVQEQIEREKKEAADRKKAEKSIKDKERRQRLKMEKKKGERGNYWSAAGKRIQDKTQNGIAGRNTSGRAQDHPQGNPSSDLTDPPEEEEEGQGQDGDEDGGDGGDGGDGQDDDGQDQGMAGASGSYNSSALHPNKRSRNGSISKNNQNQSFPSYSQVNNQNQDAGNPAFYPNPIPVGGGGGAAAGNSINFNNNPNRQNPNQPGYRPPNNNANNQMGPPRNAAAVGPYNQGGLQNSYQQQMQLGNRNFNNQQGFNASGSYPQNQNGPASVFAPGSGQLPNKSMAPPSASKATEVGDRDIFGGSGVNLESEQEALYGNRLVTQAAAENPTGVNRHGKDLIDHAHLASIVSAIARRNGLTPDPAVLDFLSAAAYLRFRNLAESMISASRHRSWSSHQRPPPTFSTSDGTEDSKIPMYHEEMISNPSKQLAALERVDRQMEEKAQLERQRRELEEANSLLDPNTSASIDGRTSGAAGAGDESKDSKSKKKPMVTAKNMSEDLSRKITNSTLAQMAGGVGVKSWMTGGSSAAALGAGNWKPKPMSAAGSPATTGGSSLPAPKFAPLVPKPAESFNENDQGSSSSSSSRLLPSSNQIKAGDFSSAAEVGAWGDVAARIKREEEEEKKNSLMVKMEDALFALEMEKSAGAGKGSGIRTLYKERAYPREKKPELNSFAGQTGSNTGYPGAGGR